MSIKRTRLCWRANPAAKEMAVEVFPTPPFCEATEIIIVHSILGKLVTGVISANFGSPSTIAEVIMGCQEAFGTSSVQNLSTTNTSALQRHVKRMFYIPLI